MRRKWTVVALVLALGAAIAGAQVAKLSPAQQRLEAARQQLREAEEQLKAAQAKRDAAEAALGEAEQNADRELVDTARAGDEGALRQVVGKLGSGSVVDYQWAVPFRGPGVDAARAVRLIQERLGAPDPFTRSKLCWLLGENASDRAAAALRDVLAAEKDANVVGAAIAALARCPDSPAGIAAVRPFAKDDRLLTEPLGYYPRGTLGKQALGQMAQEYVELRDAARAATVPGGVIVEEPTLFCAGFQWRIEGDANRDCTVNVAYRKAGTAPWKKGYPFLRCRSWDSAGTRYEFNVGNLLAGSIFDLEPGTEYEVKLSLADPDGGAAERSVQVTTRTEPPAYVGLRTLYVVPAGSVGVREYGGVGGRAGGRSPTLPDSHTLTLPSSGPGIGTKDDPFQGIAAADKAAQPGDVLILQPGTYSGSVTLTKSGEPGRPIVWRGAERGKVILDGTGKDECLALSGRDHLQFEDLSFVGASQGCIKSYGCRYVVVRRCTFSRYGMAGILGQGRAERTRNGQVEEGRNCKNWFVTDNTMSGPKDWRKDRGSRESYGVILSGAGHVIAWNRIDDCWDTISLSGSYDTQPGTGSLDICYNDLRQASDDGIEADYVFHNVRIFRNRLTNIFSGLSFQPVYGGPGYMLYNALYNTGNKPFKLHVNTTGMIVAHNTSVASREALYGSSAHDAHLLNNLLLGERGEQGYWLYSLTDPLAMDYNGYNVAAPCPLVKHNNVRYRSMAEFAADTGQMRHAVRVDWDVFAEDARPAGYHVVAQPNPLLLRPGSATVDAGVVLPGINDGFAGKAPDLGCYELGKPVPHYGPR